MSVTAGGYRGVQLEIPLLSLGLAAAGVVLDEQGQPLAGVEFALEHESGEVLHAATGAARHGASHDPRRGWTCHPSHPDRA